MNLFELVKGYIEQGNSRESLREMEKIVLGRYGVLARCRMCPAYIRKEDIIQSVIVEASVAEYEGIEIKFPKRREDLIKCPNCGHEEWLITPIIEGD